MELSLRNHRVEQTSVPLVMGILNVTPDSFSDGGDHLTPTDASVRATQMIDEGADIIDVGPESTRPGAHSVSVDEQIARSVPVIEAIRALNGRIPISIDTRLAPVAKAALDAGADMVNDVSALRDDVDMADLVAGAGAAVVLMHRRGSSADMQLGGGPAYGDVVGEIAGFMRERMRFAADRGIDPANIIFDPGIGFGKRVEHNLLILQQLDRFVALGQPLLVGASRKSFIGRVLEKTDPRERENGSFACAVMAMRAGAAIVRVHEVRPVAEAARLCRAVRNAGDGGW